MAQSWRRWRRQNLVWRFYRVTLLLLRTLYVINRERSRVVSARARGDYSVRPNIDVLIGVLADFRETAVDMGGLLIKLGQFLGARADLLPQAALDELAALHDEVAPERFEDIVALLEREWGVPVGEVCASVDPIPAGAASLGQVHEAWLLDGRHVALKVQRPGITPIVRSDLRSLRFVLWVVARLVPAANRITDLGALYREFSRVVFEELDYEHEARNAERFAKIFAEDPLIRVPGIVTSYSTRRVLALEWMDGIKVTDFDALDAAGVDRASVADRLTGSYLTQILEAGFFHADPHPGNILIQPAAGADRIVYVDFGMMGTITPAMRGGLLACFQGAMTQDAARFVRGLDTLGFLGPSADRAAIERLIAALLGRFSGAPIGEVTQVDPREVLSDAEASLYDQPFRLPADFAFFGRMAGMLLGLTVALSPSFNFLEVAKPYAARFIGQGSERLANVLALLGIEHPESLPQDLLRGGLALSRSLIDLPVRLNRILERAEQGEINLTITSADLSSTALAPTTRRLSHGLLNQPVPLWLPLSLVGAFALTRMAQRRSRADSE